MQGTFEISASESLKGTLKRVLATERMGSMRLFFFQFICSRSVESLDNSKAFCTEVSGHRKCMNETQG